MAGSRTLSSLKEREEWLQDHQLKVCCSSLRQYIGGDGSFSGFFSDKLSNGTNLPKLKITEMTDFGDVLFQRNSERSQDLSCSWKKDRDSKQLGSIKVKDNPVWHIQRRGISFTYYSFPYLSFTHL